MTGKEFISAIKSGGGGGYLFFGDESFLKSRCLAMAKEAVCEDETLDTFNYVKITPDNYSSQTVENAITAMPLMAERRFIEISGIKYSSLKQEEANDLFSSFALLGSNPQAVLIAVTTPYEFDPGYLPKRPSKQYTELTKYLKPVAFGRPTESDLKKWICRHFAAEKIDADLSVADMLILHAGHDMATLENEIEKLCMYLRAKGKNAPAAEDIEAVVCSNTEADDFAFSNALRARDRKRVFELLGMMESEKVEEIVILNMMARSFAELYDVKLFASDGYNRFDTAKALKANDYRIRLLAEAAERYTLGQLERAVEICRNADLRLKSEPVVRYALVDRTAAELLSL